MLNLIKRCGVVAAVTMLAACASESKQAGGGADPATKHFKTPEVAVNQIADMLRKEDFKTLAMYYDLSGTGIDRATLASGAFFIETERPEGAHPGGFWKYKQPFAPGFGYAGHRKTKTEGVYLVDVSIRIDQGEGQPPQIGYDEFPLRETAKGWAVLPKASK